MDDVYPFAKFNKKLEIFHYTDQEYRDVIQNMPVTAAQDPDYKRPRWSKADTDLLFRRCEQFQLRFIPITDRFNFEKTNEARKAEERKAAKFSQLQGSRGRDRKCKEKEAKKQLMDSMHKEKKSFQLLERTVEEIKDRYYTVVRAVLLHRQQKQHPITLAPFSYKQEKLRKENLEKLFTRTKEDNEKERQLIADLRKLDALIKKTEKDEK